MKTLEGLTLPIREPTVFDYSTLSKFQRCPRQGFYTYGLHRAPSAINYPIQFGVAYHKFREYLEIHRRMKAGQEKLEGHGFKRTKIRFPDPLSWLNSGSLDRKDFQHLRIHIDDVELLIQELRRR